MVSILYSSYVLSSVFCLLSSSLLDLLHPTMDPIPGLDSPEPVRTRADSLFRMDITPVRTNQVNLFFSPAQEDDQGEVAEGSYVRKTGQVPEVYTRAARRTVAEDEDESDDDRRRPEEPPSKKQRTTAGPSNAAARLAASRHALNPTSALSLFDDDEDQNNDPAASAQYLATSGDQVETFDPLKGPVGMMSGTAGGADDEGTDKRKRTRPKLDAERYVPPLFARVLGNADLFPCDEKTPQRPRPPSPDQRRQTLPCSR